MMINDWSENDLWWSSIREPFSVIIIQRVTFVILIVIINDLGFWLWSSVITSVIANYECDRRLRVWSPITSVIADCECDRRLRTSVIIDHECDHQSWVWLINEWDDQWSLILNVIINDVESGIINYYWYDILRSMIFNSMCNHRWSSVSCAIIDDLQFHVQS